MSVNCDGCGACCFEQGSPPGYLYLLSQEESERGDWPDEEDLERVKHLPAEALAILEKYEADLRANRVTGMGDGCCVWLDQDTRCCRFYEHRPGVCREFEVGSEACLRWREQYATLLQIDFENVLKP